VQTDVRFEFAILFYQNNSHRDDALQPLLPIDIYARRRQVRACDVPKA
jgi:hypothetical protein